MAIVKIVLVDGAKIDEGFMEQAMWYTAVSIACSCKRQ